jgi:hypothetical protein
MKSDTESFVGYIPAGGAETTPTSATVSLLDNASHSIIDEVIWAGQGGTDVFFQNELPYDVPSQAAWNESATFSGYPAFQVGAGVKTFQGYGMGSYVVFIHTTATLHVTEAFQVPQAAGAAFRDVFGLWIGGFGGLDSIINGTGGTATDTTDASHAPVDVVSYP